MRSLLILLLIVCLAIFSSTLLAQTTEILIGGEDTELSPDGVISGNGCLSFGGLGAAVLDTFNIYYQPLGEGDFQDNLFPDPEVYSFQMNIPDGLPDYQSQGRHGSFWNSRGRDGEGVLPWINRDWRGGQYYDAQYRPTGEEQYYGLVSDTVQWTIDYWDVDQDSNEICFIHTCLAGMVEDFTYDENTGNATALLRILSTVYLGYGDDGEPGPGAVEYNGGTYQGFDSFREPSGLLDYPAFLFQYDGESNTGSLTPCEGKVRLIGGGGLTKGYFDVIQDGIDAAEDGDTVLVSSGRYVENINFNGKAIIVASLILTTGDRAYIDSTIIDGNEEDCVVGFYNGEDSTSVLQGFIIQNGIQDFGGGIDCGRNTKPLLLDLIIKDNVARRGGGGIYFSAQSEPVIKRTIINDNSCVTGGGGIGSWLSAHAILEDVVIAGNTSDDMGGGVYAEGSRYTLSNVLIYNNTADKGGGVSLGISRNNIFRNVTIIANNSREDGFASGLRLAQSWEAGGGGSDVFLSNSIVWGNSGLQISVYSSRSASRLDVLYCDIEGGEDGIGVGDDDEINWGDGNIDDDPQFVNADEGDYHLTEDSPCIDAGDPDSPLDPDGTRADMGAYYFHQRRDPGRLLVPQDYETIQEAIDASIDGDTVLVSPGTYAENINFNGKNIIVASLLLTTENEAYIDSTIIDGDSSGTVVTFENEESEDAELVGFIITNGYCDDGGGIRCINSSPTVSFCKIESSFVEVSGGGIYISGECSPAFMRCEIINNESMETGGGISVSGNATPSFRHCLMVGNVTQEDGHTAVCSNGCSVKFINCTIAYNGVWWEHEHGSIFCVGAEVILINTISFENIIWEIHFSQWGDSSKAIISHSNIDGVSTHNNGSVQWLEGNIDEDPQFADPDNADYHLTENSPCIDAGTAFFVWEGDTLVNMSDDEYFGEAPDMGAYESEYSGVSENESALPTVFKLYQNYPNPFNPTTSLRFDLPVSGNISLKIFDIVGREITVIAEGLFKAGSYTAIWDAQNLPSGIYLARLETANVTRVVKLMLIR
jgi:hypothetical protein